MDGKKLADLEQALRQIALEENDHDPMHNYLIGLAYWTERARRDLSSSYNNLGDIAQEQGLLEETKACYEQGMALCKALAEETGTVQDCTDLAISYINLWTVEKPGIEKQVYLSQAVHIYEMLVRAYPDVENYQNMLKFLKQLDK